ncbi:phosphate acetyl/butaryl transferase family protein [Burkholderia ambifaria AMMD]|uniref:Phosphate butyryltransferase n=1 Tax=Burkholderia ambifaria (strain ATCC BAA-244 / DSM 16087 / CCUG 44356 / LMG 19182 / AMMD) TaxID=339670 RepID=Q0B8Z8_BURCM|nr:bifunctional enoyl-CoA hydratase/phosphate acetyltransferase [Burkholderia ambifaria]ABI89375.1 Phosphate butyryltransferase [Burkholderia ambifaria AMMD]AJY25419.1 phosphate acetyl/butaryl transferase family protein [Burkholderia ambifaria AMMD]MBR7930673.1 bifunctional enoyl-CoA hydratase/phosphate acetyltransferase [Burkholderia ambifaria]PEH67518.1 phosphate acetyl/butaryl transferase [Burkholderia ambifaria]QQC07943.1 bifunctional enoyl-CoA hydratase/phosphate acetyltransferase [Burkho
MNGNPYVDAPDGARLPGLLPRADGALPLLIARACNGPALVVAVVHPCDATSLAALAALAASPLGASIEPLIVAPRAKVLRVADDAGVDLSKWTIEDVPHSHAAAARAVELAVAGRAGALMKGSLHTDELMGAVVAAGSGLRTDKRMSHCFLIETPAYPRPFILTDAAVNIAPDLAQKAAITQNAVDVAHALGLACPRVAVLCAVETVNPAMRSTLDAAALAKMAERGQIAGAIVDGPLAFDNAISLRAARDKGIDSPVAGRADILVVPDIEAGNMLAKQLEYLGGAANAGIVVGARVPIVLTSRADSVAVRVASCALAALLAQDRHAPVPMTEQATFSME